MIYNRFQGDPAIKLTEQGASMVFKGGQPVMDQGLENAVVISLFTKPGYWGNDLEKESSKKIGSDYTNQRTIVEVKTLNDYVEAGRRALKWMKDVKLAETNFIITNPYNDQIQSEVTVSPIGKQSGKLLFFKNGINWINQAENPANERY